MADVYYAPRRGFTRDCSREFVARVLGEFYGYKNVIFSRSATGKPRCDAPIFFSLSHTRDYFFLAVSNEEIGIDAENLSRRDAFSAVISRLPAPERARALVSPEEFLKIYTKCEAAAKYLGRPVFAVLPKISIQQCGDSEKVVFGGEPLPVILRTLVVAGHAVSVCAAENESIEKIQYLEGE